MSAEEVLRNEINEAKRWIETGEGVYKRDLVKRIELITWSLEQLNNPKVCAVIESKMNDIIDKINKKESIIEKDPLDSELRILDWILYQVCNNVERK